MDPDQPALFAHIPGSMSGSTITLHEHGAFLDAVVHKGLFLLTFCIRETPQWVFLQTVLSAECGTSSGSTLLVMVKKNQTKEHNIVFKNITCHP